MFHTLVFTWSQILKTLGLSYIYDRRNFFFFLLEMTQRLLLLPVAASLMFFAALGDAFSYKTTQLNITRDGCGHTKLCLETPNLCDPRGNSSCLFTSVKVNGSAMTFELRGDSSGYIALELISNTSERKSVIFVCSSNNGSFVFQIPQKDSVSNTTLIDGNTTVGDIKGQIDGSVIKCDFTMSLSKIVNNSQDTTFTVMLGSGTLLNSTALSPLNFSLVRGPLDLANVGEKTTTPAPATVTTLTTPAPEANISRDGCGHTKLCLETPDLCDPRGNSSCMFTSVVVNGSALTFELSGDSSGYIALGLTSPTSQGSSNFYVCGQNSSFFFRTARRNNSMAHAPLITADLPVEGIRNKVKGNMLQCVFKIPNVNSNSRSMSMNMNTTFTVQLGNGSVSGNDLGSFTQVLEEGPLDLSDPKAGDPSTAAPPTTKAPTTKGPTTKVPGAAVRPEAVLPALLLLLSLTQLN